MSNKWIIYFEIVHPTPFPRNICFNKNDRFDIIKISNKILLIAEPADKIH